MDDRPFNDISYNRFIEENKLMGSRCRQCGASYVPPRAVCVECFSRGMAWVEFQGKGRLEAFTCIHVVPPAMEALGYGRKRPYVSGVVTLDEGGRVDARIEGVDAERPEEIQVGLRLQAKYPREGSTTVLAFEPV